MTTTRRFAIASLHFLILCLESHAVVLVEISDFSNDHLAPTILGNIDRGRNTISGSILGSEDFDSDAFVLFNPNKYVIDFISVQISSFQLPTYPPFDPTAPLIGQLPGVILVLPNSAGTIPGGDGSYHLSSDYDESGNITLEDSSALAFSVFFDSRAELLAPGGFNYSIDVVTTVPEPSSSFLACSGLAGFLVRRCRTKPSNKA